MVHSALFWAELVKAAGTAKPDSLDEEKQIQTVRKEDAFLIPSSLFLTN